MTPKIHVYQAPADKFFVNSFLVETDEGVIVIDTQFLVSTALELSTRLDRLGKKLAAVILTHPHPDHYNGLPILMRGRAPVPVYANTATIEGIRATQADKRAAWTPIYGDDYPIEDGLPDHPLGRDETLTIAGADLRLLDLGAFECADNSIIHVPQCEALIASDLIYNGAHPWLAEHRTPAWLARLDEVEAQFRGVATVYAGHGPSGTTTLFRQQHDYIRQFRERVSDAARDGEVAPEALERVIAETKQGREGWPLEGLIEMNARAVAQEMAVA